MLNSTKKSTSFVRVLTLYSGQIILKMSDVCLVVPVKGVGDVKSYAVPMGVAEAILLMLGMRLEDLHAHEVEKAPLLEHYLEMYDKGGN